MLSDSHARDAGRKMSLIRVATHAVVGRARRVHVAIAAQLLRGVRSVRAEDVVDALFLSLVRG